MNGDFNFEDIKFINPSFMNYVIGVLTKNSFPNPISQRFFSKTFTVLALTLGL